MESLGMLQILLVFAEGALSFFSPCVLPLLPIYISYLAGNAKETSPEGTIMYRRGKVFFQTCCFVLGISAAFFLLGLSFSALGSFFQENKIWFNRIAGILIILFGLFQLDVFRLPFLQQERKISFSLQGRNVNPFWAFIMGFTFSFAWTPCVGPALSSVLILASAAQSPWIGNLLILVYALGFIIPFLVLGLFTGQVLNFFKKKQAVVRYTIKIGGVILILLGVMTLTGWMGDFSSMLTAQSGDNTAAQQQPAEEEQEEVKVVPAFDFTLQDQYGQTHTLSDYKGQVVVLNFWATWCPQCKLEMPALQSLYTEYGENLGDVVFLGIDAPKSDLNPFSQEGSKEEVIAFLDENQYTFPTVFDETGEVTAAYYINGFPTTFFIDQEGNVALYAPGRLPEDTLRQVIRYVAGEIDSIYPTE